MPYREDSLVQREKAAASNPILNQSGAEPQRDQLTASHDPVLALGQLTDRLRRLPMGRNVFSMDRIEKTLRPWVGGGHRPTVAGPGARVVR